MVRLLNDACPMDKPDAEGWQLYWFESHCVGYTIEARTIEGAPGWEVRKVEAQSV
jgi:hypothetical protein